MVEVEKYNDNMMDLARRCRTGDQLAYTEVYRLFARKIYNTILRFVAHSGDAEDILQDCFIDAFTKMDTYLGTGSLEGWIRSIAINKSLSHLRNRKMSMFELDADIHQVADLDEDHLEFMPYTCEQIHRAILQLSDGYRTIVNLYVFENMPHEEIAKVLGISHSTVRSQYHRAKKRIGFLLQNFK